MPHIFPERFYLFDGGIGKYIGEPAFTQRRDFIYGAAVVNRGADDVGFGVGIFPVKEVLCGLVGEGGGVVIAVNIIQRGD